MTADRTVPWRTIWATLGSLLLLAVLWFAHDLFFLAFLSIIGAIFLRSLAHALQRVVNIPDTGALLITLLLLGGLITGLGFLFAPAVSEQLDALSEDLPKAYANVKAQIETNSTGRRLTQQVSRVEKWLSPTQVTAATGAVTATVGVVVLMIVLFVTSLFLAFSPEPYVRGALAVVPPRRRKEAQELLYEIKDTLRGWILGKAFAMTVIGIMTSIGLWIIDVPLALILAILAALASFIPNLGPILAITPALLLALSSSPSKVAWVAGLYVLVQIVEGNILTPMVERRTVSILPALVIFTQLLFGTVFGFLGVLLATPIAAVILVAVKHLYVEPMNRKKLSAREA